MFASSGVSRSHWLSQNNDASLQGLLCSEFLLAVNVFSLWGVMEACVTDSAFAQYVESKNEKERQALVDMKSRVLILISGICVLVRLLLSGQFYKCFALGVHFSSSWMSPLNAMLQCENQILRTSNNPEEEKWKRSVADQILGAINEQQKGNDLKSKTKGTKQQL
jgi:hypothetical protein